MVKVVIIDDEENARITLRELLAMNCPNVEVIGEADSAKGGVQCIRETQPDAIFLDIQMNGGSGFDLLDQFPRPDFRIIFTTAFDQFALKAFKYHAMDYLLKPIDPDYLIRAVRRISDHKDLEESTSQITRFLETVRTEKFEKIALSTNEGLIFLKLKEIVRLEATSNYTTFFTVDGNKILVAKTLKDYADILPEDIFSRTHQSHIVNLDHVRKVLKEDGGYAITEDNARIPISRRKKDSFIDALTRRSIQ